MSPLPKVPDLALPAPTNEQLEALDDHLARITDADPFVRRNAIREILEVGTERLSAIHRRLTTLDERAQATAMKKTLLDIRDRARDDLRKRMRALGDTGKVVTPDYLEMLSEHARPQDPSWKHVASVVAMSRMLRQIGTVESARELISIYVRFGEFLRVDTQLQLEKMGDASIPALIEATQHKASKINRWARRQLDLRGKAIPSEAVQTPDQHVLSDVLRAYGRTRDPDAARLVISFANSERAQIRLAARQAVAMMGEVAHWQLSDTYENVVGKKPPRDWSWERTARELFTEFDRLRLSRVYRLFQQGRAAHRDGRLDAMVDAFDKALARSPVFEHRGQMAAGYLEYARAVQGDNPQAAIQALRRVERISEDRPLEQEAKSLRLTLEAQKLLDTENVADDTLLARAIELDATNTAASKLRSRLVQGEARQRASLNRYLGAAAIGMTALFATFFVFWRRPRRNQRSSDSEAAGGDDSPPRHDSAEAPETREDV